MRIDRIVTGDEGGERGGDEEGDEGRDKGGEEGGEEPGEFSEYSGDLGTQASSSADRLRLRDAAGSAAAGSAAAGADMVAAVEGGARLWRSAGGGGGGCVFKVCYADLYISKFRQALVACNRIVAAALVFARLRQCTTWVL